MDDISDKTVLLYDYGAGISLARRLSREFGKVLYFCPWKQSNPESVKLAVGDGFPEITRVRHFFKAVDEADLVVFPGIYDGDLQVHLENIGKRVWGSRMGERLEYDRPFFAKTLEKVGLPTPGYKIIHGLENLVNHLKRNEDKWIKLNLRGDDETWKHDNYDLSEIKLDGYRSRFGPIANDMMFTIVDNIDSIVEVAYDGFMVASPDLKPQFPDIGFLGYEDKNKSHILTAIPYGDFPDVVRNVNDKFAPELARYKFRSAFGTEIRDGFFLDSTCRQPSPPGEIIMEMVKNLGAFFWHGSVGKVIPLEIEDQVGVMVCLHSGVSRSNWSRYEIPKEIDRWVKLERCCRKNGATFITPFHNIEDTHYQIENIGSVVSLCCDIEGAIEKITEVGEQVKAMGLEFETTSLAETLKRIHKGEKEGIEFTDDKVPEPGVVLDS